MTSRIKIYHKGKFRNAKVKSSSKLVVILHGIMRSLRKSEKSNKMER